MWDWSVSSILDDGLSDGDRETMMPRCLTGLLLVGLACAATSGIDAAPPESTDDALPAQKLDYLRDRLRLFRVGLDGAPSPFHLQDAPIFRWQNNISGADGAVFVWTHLGRPVLLAKTHINEGKSIYVESMAPLTGDKLVMAANGKTVWAPSEPAVIRATLKDVAAPAEGNSGRLVQMRAIARQYRFSSLWGEENPSDWELRLLPTPLYRYSSDEAKVIDGAIFGYAQGTNPETVVVVEAVSTEEGPVWQAVPSRLTGYAVRAWHNDTQVLDVPKATNTPVNASFRHHWERLSPYPLPKTQE
jgi:hypothetical protein